MRTDGIVALFCAFCFTVAAEMHAPGEKVSVDKAQKQMPVPPEAPAEFRRPAGYSPRLYPLTLRELSSLHSAEMADRAAQSAKKLAETNAKGKWKASAESIDSHRCPEWFEDAKLGIFIDWGLWSLASWCPMVGSRLYPDWYELRMYSDYSENSPFWGYRSYHVKNWGADFERDHFIPLFQAKTFDAAKLAELFKECGARYVVPFLKHHSGFCLWDSSYTFRDTVDMGPHRDIAREIVEACHKNGLKFGFYFSLGEWEYPLLGENGALKCLKEANRIEPLEADVESKASGKVAVRDYFTEYSLPQAVEFIDKYDPDLLWYDYDWVSSPDKLRTYDLSAYFYNKAEGRKDVAVNDRYGNGTAEETLGRKRKWLRCVRGDFFTDELGDTSDCIDPAKHHPWEACRGISRAFGNHWQDNEENVLSEHDFICTFVDMVARGGNLLLLVNLDGQGAIPAVQEKRLREIGAWLKSNGEAIYSTRIIAPFATEKVSYTRSKDGKTIYAVVKDVSAKTVSLAHAPADGAGIHCISTGTPLKWRKTESGAEVELPARVLPITLKFQRK